MKCIACEKILNRHGKCKEHKPKCKLCHAPFPNTSRSLVVFGSGSVCSDCKKIPRKLDLDRSKQYLGFKDSGCITL